MGDLTKAELQEALDKANARIAELESGDSNARIAELEAELASANGVAEELNRENEKLVKQRELKTDLPIVKVGGQNYMFTAARFNMPGRGVLAASDLSDDAEALVELLTIEGQGILVELKTEED